MQTTHTPHRHNSPKNTMLAVQMWRRHMRNKKLRSIRIRPCICHRQNARTIMLQCKGAGLIIELITRISRPCPLWIASLDHKTTNDTMELNSIVETPSRQKYKVVHRFGHRCSKQLYLSITLVP